MKPLQQVLDDLMLIQRVATSDKATRVMVDTGLIDDAQAHLRNLLRVGVCAEIALLGGTESSARRATQIKSLREVIADARDVGSLPPRGAVKVENAKPEEGS